MTAITLNQLKAKITRLHHLEKQWILLDNDEHDMIKGEKPSLYHLIRARKRQDARIVHAITNSTGATQTTLINILRTFSDFTRRKYDTTPVDESIRQPADNKNNMVQLQLSYQ